ncbi:ion channel [Thiolapillus sp.]
MLINLLLGLPTMLVSLFLQLAILLVAIRYYHRHERQVESTSLWSSLIVASAVMLLLVAGNLMQIAFWSWLFLYLREFDEFKTAFYHSTVNFASLGYGDIVMSEKHRLLGALEAINGVLMIGVSTATMMALFQDAMRKTLSARRQDMR